MKITILLILLCYTYCSIASNTHNIPIEEYSTELQDLGQHVEYKETPVRVIKITKTVAVKVPVPYPVKVIEKVPYPVHVAKPYPVQVPQIVRIPHEAPAHHAHAPQHALGDHSYNVHENTPSDDYSFQPSVGHFGGQEKSYTQATDEQPSDYGGSYDAPASPATASFYGHAEKEDSGSAETKAYDDAIKQYLQKNAENNNAGAGAHRYY